MDSIITSAPNGAAPNFSTHQYQQSWNIPASVTDVWRWLNSTETFTKGQPPSFRVEFIAPHKNLNPDFTEGVICSHFGPLMMFAGVISKVEEPSYRDLQYYYGSYALSFWFIRPTRLQFWLEGDGEASTILKLQVDSFVRNGFHWMWTAAQTAFWYFFPVSIRRGITTQ